MSYRGRQHRQQTLHRLIPAGQVLATLSRLAPEDRALVRRIERRGLNGCRETGAGGEIVHAYSPARDVACSIVGVPYGPVHVHGLPNSIHSHEIRLDSNDGSCFLTPGQVEDDRLEAYVLQDWATDQPYRTSEDALHAASESCGVGSVGPIRPTPATPATPVCPSETSETVAMSIDCPEMDARAQMGDFLDDPDGLLVAVGIYDGIDPDACADADPDNGDDGDEDEDGGSVGADDE